MRTNGRVTNTKKKKEKARGNKVKERRERDEETVAGLAGYKRTAVASNPFAAEGDYVKSSRATIAAARSCAAHIREKWTSALRVLPESAELISSRLHKAFLCLYIIL